MSVPSGPVGRIPAPAQPPADTTLTPAPALSNSTEALTRPAALSSGGAYRLGFFLALGALTTVGLVTALTSLQTILVALSIAIFTALGVQPIIEWFIRRGLPRTAAAVLVALGLILVVAACIGALAPLIVDQVMTFGAKMPEFTDALRDNPQLAALDQQFKVFDKVTAAVASGSWVTVFFGGLTGASLAAVNLFVSTVLVIVLSVYLTFSAPALKEAIYQLAPASRRPRVRYLANQIFQRIGDYLIAMVVVVALWAIVSFVALNVVGLGQYALALSLVVGALALIPAVGSTISIVLCGLIGLAASPTAALGIAVTLLVYQQLDAYVVQPRLFSRSLKVPPVLVILGASCGIALLGVVGALLAIPTTASLLLLYREVIVPKLDAS